MRKRICLLVAVLSMLASLAPAQTITGSITGTVSDPSGASVPGAEVKATATNTGVVRTATSAQDGTYVLANLPIGPYRIEGSTFIYADRNTGRVTAILGYPTQKIAQAG